MKRSLIFCFIALIAFAFYACQKEYSFEIGKANATVATGSLYDSVTGNCLPNVVHGTYYNGVATGGDTNYVTITVHVTSPGTYRIQTDVINGFSFFDSGYFSQTGYDTIHLKASGTPEAIMQTDFSVIFDTSVCGFTINVQDSTGTGLGGNNSGNPGGNTGIDTAVAAANSWKLTDSTNSITYQGPMFSAGMQTDSVGNPFFGLLGTTLDAEIFELGVIFPNGEIQTGTYPIGTASGFALTNTSGDTLYVADGSAGTNLSYVKITGFDANTKVITGQFRSWARDGNGNKVYINNGAFNAITQ